MRPSGQLLATTIRSPKWHRTAMEGRKTINHDPRKETKNHSQKKESNPTSSGMLSDLCVKPDRFKRDLFTLALWWKWTFSSQLKRDVVWLTEATVLLCELLCTSTVTCFKQKWKIHLCGQSKAQNSLERNPTGELKTDRTAFLKVINTKE